MYVELIDRLRCPNAHADTWLVAAASRTAHRRLIDATLGCVECGAEFAVVGGEVRFGAAVPSAPMLVSEDEALRAAALLTLTEGGLYLLDGGWGSFAPALQAKVEMDLLLADPPGDGDTASVPLAGESVAAAGQGILRGVADRWPLAASSVHGIALDRATPARAVDAVRVLRTGGRLVAPASTPLPAGVHELARDDRHWVAEKVGDVVALGRRQR